MKIYIHKEYFLPALFFSALCVLGCYELSKNGFSFTFIILLMLSFPLAVFSILLLWKFRNTNRTEFKKRYDRLIVTEFGNYQIVFPKGYDFGQSTISKSRRVDATQINEVNIDRYPPSMVIDNREVIFVDYAHKEDLKDFAIRNNIYLVNRFDIWGAINEEFLDTEITDAEKTKTLALLSENGISLDETAAIRKRISINMTAFTWASLEWVHISHYDVLSQLMSTSKNYWWTMEIALRNRKKD